MNVFIGLDVSLASTAICVLGPQGKVVEELKAASEPEALVRAMASLPYAVDAIGLEAGPLSQWLSKGIEEADVVVVRFGEKYRQWNAAFDAGFAAALGKPMITLHDPDLTHPLKEVDGAALAVAQTPDQVVKLLTYAINGTL